MEPGAVLSTSLCYAYVAACVPGISPGAVNDLLLLLAGTRTLARLSCSVKSVPAIQEALCRLGLTGRLWKSAIQPVRTLTATQEYVVAGHPVPLDPGEHELRSFLFVARDDALAELAEGFAMDDAMLGALLDYPGCCIRAFEAHRPHHMQHLHPAFARAGRKPLPFWTNTMVDAFGWHLTSHFPCSADCSATRTMAIRYWSALAEIDPEHATHCLAHLRSVVLHSPELGLAYGSAVPHPDFPEGGRRLCLLGTSDSWRQRLAALGGDPEIEIEREGAVCCGGRELAPRISVYDFTGGADDAG